MYICVCNEYSENQLFVYYNRPSIKKIQQNIIEKNYNDKT